MEATISCLCRGRGRFQGFLKAVLAAEMVGVGDRLGEETLERSEHMGQLLWGLIACAKQSSSFWVGFGKGGAESIYETCCSVERFALVSGEGLLAPGARVRVLLCRV